MTPPGRSSRLAALDLLTAVLERGQSLAETGAETDSADPRDRAFARHLAYGVLRWKAALDWLAAQLLKRSLKEKDQDVHRLLLLGLFQLWQDRTAPHAAIHETAGCARDLGKPWAVPLVNAVLRRFQREQPQWLELLAGREERFAHPDWLLETLRTDWPADWPEIVAANNQPAPLWLRLNSQGDPDTTFAELTAGGYQVTAHPMLPGAVRVDPPTAVESLPGFAAGRFSVQDPAAQLAADLLGVQSGHHVLDACAAPGGKTGHLLEQVPDMLLTALDRSESRLRLVRQNLGRLGQADNSGVRLLAADAGEPETWWDGIPFQRILLDAPCTATGVIRRHPEIKWLRTFEQLQRAAATQARLLRRLWPLLETSGILLYATCSVLRLENNKQIQQFIEQHADAEPIAIDADWGREQEFGRQILPGEHDMDGFFYARLRKKP
jgi:16S rRNA (cytosine967-C5)-methyltransferase